MGEISNNRQERETDRLLTANNALNEQNSHSSQGYDIENAEPPVKVYAVLFWLWGLFFWVFMLVGGLHGLIMKGPVELARKREEWVSNGYLEWWGWLILAIIIIFFALTIWGCVFLPLK